jgi:hypothetical protein
LWDAESESLRNPALRLYLTVVLHAKKANVQLGTFGFCRPTLALSLSKGAKRKKPKELFFANAMTEKMKFEKDKKNLK